MSSFIRLGIVGCGNIIRAHLHGFKTLREYGFDNFRVVALCDERVANAWAYRKRGEGPEPRPPKPMPWDDSHLYVSDIHDDTIPDVYADWREMLELAPLDAVLITAPIFLHHQVALACLRKGYHVLTEKPLAISVRAGQRMVEEAARRRVSLGVAEEIRYQEVVRAQRFVLDSTLIGPIQMWLCAAVAARGDNVIDGTPWRHRRLLAGGGFALDAGVHRFDQIRYLCGEVAEISALAPRIEPRRYLRDEAGRVIEAVDSEVEDMYFANLRLANGVVGATLEGVAGHGEPTSLRDGPVIYGAKGCLKGGEVVLDDGSRVAAKDILDRDASAEIKERWFPRGIRDRFAVEDLDFFRSIEHSRPMETDGEEGLRDLACCFAVLESAALNRPVEVADVLNGRVDAYQQPINHYYKI